MTIFFVTPIVLCHSNDSQNSCNHLGMRFINHPETSNFSLGSTFKGGLFAIPILLHPQLIKPGLDPLCGLDCEAVGRVLQETKVLSHKQQDVTFLSRPVDARFVCGARGVASKSVMKTLVSLHRSMPEYANPEDLFHISGFDPSGGGLVFLIGAVYRQIIDPHTVTLPCHDDFLSSRARFAMEIALSGAGAGMFRHQVLAPMTLSKAIAEGVSAAVRCWNGLFDGPMSCEFDLNVKGDVTMKLNHGDEAAVALRFGHDAITERDLQLIQQEVTRSASSRGNNSANYLH